MSAGEPVTEHSDLIGAAFQLAARLVDRAEPGTVLVSGAWQGPHLPEAWQVRPKGFAEPVQVFEVVWQEQERGSDRATVSP
jgi:class 3 adenylate cyclase